MNADIVCLAMAKPLPIDSKWFQVLTVRTWYGFGFRNFTMRFRGRVIVKFAVKVAL